LEPDVEISKVAWSWKTGRGIRKLSMECQKSEADLQKTGGIWKPNLEIEKVTRKSRSSAETPELNAEFEKLASQSKRCRWKMPEASRFSKIQRKMPKSAVLFGFLRGIPKSAESFGDSAWKP
jgi:hypothetical protein